MRLLIPVLLAWSFACVAADDVGRKVFTLKPDKAKALEAVRKGVGVMPPYAGKLTPEQIEAVASYVAEVAGK